MKVEAFPQQLELGGILALEIDPAHDASGGGPTCSLPSNSSTRPARKLDDSKHAAMIVERSAPGGSR